MNFEDLKDKIKETFQNLWAQIQENQTFQNLQERYQTLPPNAQSGIMLGAIAVVVLMVLSIPMSYIGSSSDTVALFEENRSVIRELLKVSRVGPARSPLPPSEPFTNIQARIQNALGQYALLPEQVKSISENADGTRYAANPIQEQAIKISIEKLNVNQLTQVGYGLQRLGDNIKLMGMEITASQGLDHYYDVIYQLVVFSLDDVAPPAPDTKKAPPSRGSRAKDEDT